MRNFMQILEVANDVEAQLLDAYLSDHDIPHVMVSFHDSAYTGIFQAQFGWGYVEAPPEYEEIIKEMYDDIKKSAHSAQEND